MMKYMMMIVLYAMLAIGSNSAAIVATGAEIPGVNPGSSLLTKTWTTEVQKKEADSQVLANTALASRGSFEAEGKGFEPATVYPAPFQTCTENRANSGNRLSLEKCSKM